MTIHMRHSRELALLNLVGLSLYRLIVKARILMNRTHRAAVSWENISQEWNDETAIGYEAGWAGIKPRL